MQWVDFSGNVYRKEKNDRTLTENNRKEKKLLMSSVVSRVNFSRSPFVRKRGPGKGRA